MIEFLMNHENGIMMNNCTFLDMSLQSFIKRRTRESFMNLTEYRRQIRKQIIKSYQIPIYISEEEIYVSTQGLRNRECILINYKRIIGIVDLGQNQTQIIFASGFQLNLLYSYDKFKRNQILIQKIQDHLSKVKNKASE